MERDWRKCITLNMADISSGILSNNRFLQRVNPAITRALADSGSSFNHPEIHRLARNMVDLGIWDNLVLWQHEDLVKIRTVSNEAFVEKSYDIISNDYNAINTDTTQQPKLVSGFLFDGTNDRLIISDNSLFTFSDGSNDLPFSVVCWVNRTTGSGGIPLAKATAINNGEWYAGLFFFRTVDSNSGGYRGLNATGISTQPPSPNVWYQYVYTYNGNASSTGMNIYRNNININSEYIDSSSGTYTRMRDTTTQIFIGSRGTGTYFNGTISDIRVFRNKVLSTNEISSIYDATKSKYGY